MKLLGSIEYEGKKYSIEDTRGFKEPAEFGMSNSFYGGRVDKVAGTDVKGLYMLVEKHKVIDLMTLEEQLEEVEELEGEKVPFDDTDYSKYTNAELREMLEDAGVDVPSKATKDELIDMFK